MAGGAGTVVSDAPGSQVAGQVLEDGMMLSDDELAKVRLRLAQLDAAAVPPDWSGFTAPQGTSIRFLCGDGRVEIKLDGTVNYHDFTPNEAAHAFWIAVQIYFQQAIEKEVERRMAERIKP